MKKGKLLKSILSIFLIFVLLFGSFGCGEKEETVKNGERFSLPSSSRFSFYGVHESNVSDTEEYFVKNGKTDYVLIAPEGIKGVLSEARADLLLLFKKATGIDMVSRTDKEVEADYDITKKYISLGQTTLVEKAGINKSEYSVEKLKTEGVRIITKGNTIFILGGNDYGVSNAVYVFLEIYFNFDYFYRNCITIDTGITDLKFKSLDVTEVPDVEHFRGNYYCYTYYQGVKPTDADALGAENVEAEVSYMDNRSRCHMYDGERMWIHETFDYQSNRKHIHNVLEYLPKNAEFTLSDGRTIKCTSDMYSKGSQLCLSGHGKPEVVQDMVDICVEKIIFSLKYYTPDKYPKMNHCTFTMEDNNEVCMCDACKKDYEEIKASGQLVRFVNKIGEKVEAWLEAQKDESAEFHDAYREDFVILFFAYSNTVEPPVDENLQPLSDEVICRKNVGVELVSSSNGVKAASDIYDQGRGRGLEQLEGWYNISKNSARTFWYNSGNVASREFFCDSLTMYNNNFWEVLAKFGYENVFSDHYISSGADVTCWSNLLHYITSKLRWNCHTDIQSLIEKFMYAMYDEGGKAMYELYKDEVVYYVAIRARHEDPWEFDWGRSLGADDYPYPVLKGWVDKCDEAIDAISYLQTQNPKKYRAVKQRIEIETAAHLARIVSLYGGLESKPFTQETLNSYRSRLGEIGKLSPTMQILGIKLVELGE